MGATSGAEIAYQSEHLNTPLVFDVVGIVQSLIFRVLWTIICLSTLFRLVFVLCILRFMH